MKRGIYVERCWMKISKRHAGFYPQQPGEFVHSLVSRRQREEFRCCGSQTGAPEFGLPVGISSI
jgi:hypothetical protein